MIAAPHESTLWQEYRERLFRFVLRRVDHAATAEDIVHDVLVRAYAHRDSLRDGRRFEQWLYQITRNAVIDHDRARRPTAELPADLAAADEDASGGARRELARCIQPLVQALPPHYRDAVRLSELEGRTQQATADALGLSLSGAKSRVQRGRRMLQERLLECCRIEFDSRGALAGYEARNGCGGSDEPEGDGGCGGCGAP